jgi:hypothetical protein
MVGNHDLDFGILQMRACIKKMYYKDHLICKDSPLYALRDAQADLDSAIQVPLDTPEPHNTHWLLSNIRSSPTMDYGLGGLLRHYTMERSGRKIGFIGMAEFEWI